MRLTRAQQQEQTRQRLLDAALGVLRQRGIGAATVDEIAELAGYSRGAFYSHFGSKEAVVVELLELHAPEGVEGFRRAVEVANSEPGILRAIAAPWVSSSPGQTTSARLDTAELAARICDVPELRERLLRVQQQVEDVLGWCAEEICRRRGRELTLPASVAGMAMLALLSGFSQRQLVEPDQPIDKHLESALLSLILGASQ